MPKNDFDFKSIEKKWREFWEKEKIYKFDANKSSKKKIFSIDTPPPTVSGKMHIGHAFSYSQQDFIIRFKRMQGFKVYYPFGTDDNGLPTERLVEKEKNVKAKDMPREEFINLCLMFLKKELPEFIQDWKDIGISCDFDSYYSTINEYARRISQWSFLDLYKKGRVYRKDAPAMWCPECQTGISQVEAQDKEIETIFNDIVFHVNGKELVISTTRPELLPACVAVFHHPSDKRYKKLRNQKAKVPLFNFEVPILEDERVDKDKGTGIVMCCTFGDQTDMAWQKAYNLEIKEAITRDGKMSSIAGKYYRMKIKKAREEIIKDLKNKNLLKSQKKINHFVNVHERCGTEIEFVKSKQWFVKYLDLKKDMLKWGKELNWYPRYMKTRYDNWVKGLQWDWLISRQRYFGVPFPVWYCKKCGNVVFADEKKLPVDPLKDFPEKKCSCGSSEFKPERDVLDTWFTSSMSPQLASQLLDQKTQKKVFPFSLRPQAHDIITFWLFNTLVKSHLHFGKNPWRDVVISGFVTMKGEKMSKSKGNVIKPQDVMEKYGADAIRYWAASSKLGEDFNYQEKDVITGKKFVTKLMNAAKFVFMNLNDFDFKKPKRLEVLDELFLKRLDILVSAVTYRYEMYEYSGAKHDIDYFFWKYFCDNYLELVKKRVYEGEGEKKTSVQYTLYTSLLTILKLIAPIIPFITEEIYQNYFRKHEKDKSIHISSWPRFRNLEKENYENTFGILIDRTARIRAEKTKAKKPMNSEIVLTLEKKDIEKMKDVLEDLKDVANCREVKEGKFKVEFV